VNNTISVLHVIKALNLVSKKYTVSLFRVKVKVKFTLEQVTKAQKESREIVILFL
jgi:hypothetical protein